MKIIDIIPKEYHGRSLLESVKILLMVINHQKKEIEIIDRHIKDLQMLLDKHGIKKQSMQIIYKKD